jgi:hypothetical protein
MAEGLSNREVALLATGLAVGVSIGYFTAQYQFDKILKLELEKAQTDFDQASESMRMTYERARQNWEKPELKAVVEELGYASEVDEGRVETTDQEVAEVKASLEKNVFDTEMPEWNYEIETGKRVASPELPYILHKDEFFENEPDHEQTTITWYNGDDVLADERDEVIEPREHIVGNDNLKMMGTGHGSGDPNVIYIRNDRTGHDYEVIFSGGSFSEEVAGFIEHAETFQRNRRGHPKFDDE